MPVGALRGGVEQPQLAGADRATECTWERTVEDCPRIRDKLRHMIRCTKGRQTSSYSLYAPRN